MRSYGILLMAAAAVFLAFVGLVPEDVRRAGSGSAGSMDRVMEGSPVAELATNEAAEAIEESRPATASMVEEALAGLAGNVRTQSHPDALASAFRAYFNYRTENPEKVRKPYLYFVDYGLNTRTPRGYVFDMDALTVVDGPFMVAHGRGSVRSGGDAPTSFSNVRGSNATSLGLYLAQETYAFRGRSGGRTYRSVGLRLQGLSGRFNSAARTRGIVVHGAPYVTAQNAGRSEGCPAMEQHRAQKLIPQIANGGMVFHFSPRDREWMAGDPWTRTEPGSLARLDG